MFRPSYPLRTERLLLRPFMADDLDEVWAYQREPEVSRYMQNWEPRDRERTRVAVTQMVRENDLLGEGDCLSLAVVLEPTGAVIGQVELVWLSEQHRQGEIGYVFNPAYQGRGLATEAARVMLGLGFEQMRLHRIIGRCDARNRASAGLLERLGMRQEAHFVGNTTGTDGWRDELVFAMLGAEWPAHAGT
ncbi:GNAT family N-acetyltransferase [Micromonosporaceae bacterium Da 78-11]